MDLKAINIANSKFLMFLEIFRLNEYLQSIPRRSFTYNLYWQNNYERCYRIANCRHAADSIETDLKIQKEWKITKQNKTEHTHTQKTCAIKTKWNETKKNKQKINLKSVKEGMEKNTLIHSIARTIESKQRHELKWCGDNVHTNERNSLHPRYQFSSATVKLRTKETLNNNQWACDRKR